jgi:uncharacterized protein (TIGR02147 family)
MSSSANGTTLDANYRTRLVGELVLRQRRNPTYSLRSFARDLGISPAALSQSMSAKRNLSKANILKVAERLAFSPSETAAALTEIRGASPSLVDSHFVTLHDDTFQLMSNWYYFAILSLAETGEAKADPAWLAKRFAISSLEAREAIERLKRLCMITVRRGLLQYDGTPLRSTSDIPSSAARSLQKDHLRLAAASLEQDPIHLRDMTSMTMAIRADRIPRAKEMIKTFRRKLSKYLEAEGGEEVYVLGVQLFPVTKKEER